MNKKIKLNLGSGFMYKVGYINIDKFDDNSADKIYDAADLPHKKNSIDLIEASQLIEHFDYAHCKYILSEWFRVLKPNAELIIETPDLEKTFRKFISSDLKTKKTTLQWIYGIDSEGMQHKTGFTFTLLKDLLEEIGFKDISREKPKTHLYEPGMRVVCKKPDDYIKKQLFACFRKSLKSELKIDDSYILIPLENSLSHIFSDYDKLQKNQKDYINRIISKTVICNPQIPLIFLKECVKFDLIKESIIKEKIDFLSFLVKNEFHKKIFSLWIKNRKNMGSLAEEFNRFVEDIKSLILDLLKNKTNYKERLDYIISLESTDVIIFDLNLVYLKGKKLFNKGIKQFHKHNFLKAINFFLQSSKIDPYNALVYWDMARLGLVLKDKENKIINNYEKALKLTKKRKNKKKIETELEYLRKGKISLISKEPISESC